jgi:signal transduction histidine kinase
MGAPMDARFAQIAKLVADVEAGTLDTQIEPSSAGDDLDQLIVAMKRAQGAGQKRLDEFIQVMLAFASLDFGVRAHVGERGNVFDAVAAGLNMLAEELAATTVARSDLESVNRRLETSLEEVRTTQKQLLDASRQAGMAEVATGVLHNVGNVLTSLNTSANLVIERLNASRVPFLSKAVGLIPPSREPQAQNALVYLGKLATQLEEDRAQTLSEMHDLHGHLQHVTSVVSRQQDYASRSAVLERTSADEIVDAAMYGSATVLRASGARVVRSIVAMPPVLLDRHGVTDILANLLANAASALETVARDERRIDLGVSHTAAGHLEFTVTDCGIGIAPEHRAQLFKYGFTTRAGGHGFGLASSLLAAKAMGGTLRARSEGLGKGATFTLAIPYRPADPPHEKEPTV